MLQLPYRVVLASASPRRKALLSKLIPDFEVVPAEVEETLSPGVAPTDGAIMLAYQKAVQVAQAHPDALVIGGDTVVAIRDGAGWTQLGKPTDEGDARVMLRVLAGRTHSVFTGVALVAREIREKFVVETMVSFRDISDEEIDAYIATGEPMDKAGAYGIQGGAAAFVFDLEGSLSNVIGLPMQELERRLKRFSG